MHKNKQKHRMTETQQKTKVASKEQVALWRDFLPDDPTGLVRLFS